MKPEESAKNRIRKQFLLLNVVKEVFVYLWKFICWIWKWIDKFLISLCKSKYSLKYGLSLGLVMSILIICFFMIVIYKSVFNGGFSHTSSDWGNFGSYLSAITGLLAFVAVLFTAQEAEKRAKKAEEKAEEKDAKAEEQAIRREEREIFFKLLESHREKVQSIIYTFQDENNQLRGIEAFQIYINMANNLLLECTQLHCILTKPIEEFVILSSDKRSPFQNNILEKCNAIYYNEILGKYYPWGNDYKDIDFSAVKEYIRKHINTKLFF